LVAAVDVNATMLLKGEVTHVVTTVYQRDGWAARCESCGASSPGGFEKCSDALEALEHTVDKCHDR